MTIGLSKLDDEPNYQMAELFLTWTLLPSYQKTTSELASILYYFFHYKYYYQHGNLSENNEFLICFPFVLMTKPAA